MKTLYITILLPGGSRRTLLYGQGKTDVDPKCKVVKYMINGCNKGGKVVHDLRIGVVKQFLAQDFSFVEEYLSIR